MSNTILFDPLLVRYLADELNRRVRGRGCSAAPLFAADRSVTLPLDRGEQLRIDLHPMRGFIRVVSTTPEALAMEIDSTVVSVTAPPDERILVIQLRDSSRFTTRSRSVVVELHTNQWNAIVCADDGRIASVLNARFAGSRSLVAGATYAPPPFKPRFGVGTTDRGDALEFWSSRIGAAAPDTRRTVLLGEFAYTGSINAGWILGGESSSDADPDGAFERWWWIRGLPAPQPTLIERGNRLQPYPVALAGLPGVAVRSLLAAMEQVADSEVEASPEPSTDRFLPLITGRLAEAKRKAERLRRELATSTTASDARSNADLLLARIQDVRRGDTIARLEDWEGGVVEFALDPQLSPAENAARLYEVAGRRERAAAQLPALIAAADADVARWAEAADFVARSEVPDWLVAYVADKPESQRSGGGAEEGMTLPYRRFRTSGGLEVRVGKGAKENDRLTFRESAPEDVWLHAQSVPGSHVILRWKDANASPPARDLAEAAQLAAVFSKARTSSTVAVDWTRRKHVRKPRGAAPGSVLPQRVKTVFVEPDDEIVERLAVR